VNEDNFFEQANRKGLFVSIISGVVWAQLYNPEFFNRKLTGDGYSEDSLPVLIREHLEDECGKKDWNLLISKH
jgi:hypothetical protein